ncbi:MAG: TldD/PmbA family protein [Candidatus Nanoarchaeia archaeon]
MANNADDQFLELLHHIKDKLIRDGADDAVVSGSKTFGQQIKFVNNKIAKTGTEGMVNIGVFFVKDRKIVTTSFKEAIDLSADSPLDLPTMGFLKEKSDKLIQKLFEFSKPLQPKEDWFGIADGPFKYKKIPDTYDSKIANISAEQQVDLVEKGIVAALKEGAKRCGGIFETNTEESFLVTSRNVETKDKGTSVYYSIRALLDKEASGHNTASERMLNKLDVEETAKFAGQIAVLAKKPKAGKKGIFDVVFAPMSWGALLDQIGGATSIFEVEAGTSFFANKLGQQVASPIVNLYDDATIPGGYGSTECDSEGVSTKRNILIENGILKNYLFNASTARKYKTNLTGNAGLIAPHPWNLILEPGKMSKDELFKLVQKGLYITNIWYTRYQNYAAGDFSTIPRDGIFLIENGQISKSLKNIRIKGNMINMLQNLAGIASDARQMTSWEIHTPVITPHVLIKEVNITKPTK